MKPSHVLALGLTLFSTTTAWEEPPFSDGNFCIRWDNWSQGARTEYHYAVQIQSEQHWEGLCGGLWANLDARHQPKCSVRPNGAFNGCQPRGQPFEKNGRTMYTTWWWFTSYVGCNGEHVTWIADQATNISLTWRKDGLGSEVKCYDKWIKDHDTEVEIVSMLDPSNWEDPK